MKVFGNGLLPPSPPAQKATACQDQARQSSTGDGAGDGDGGEAKKRHLGTHVHKNNITGHR